ncbi:MAG: hypothetical protein AVDCRST_MAG30-2272 [uncultured Solirubrobacteraceae bacterium]|uniref:Uncharacterized protein n=1 Tax=uncultured Solirubrobacteraceae bacterium TaxID=1162706 RepID=A0A6J4SWE4_9ACTN|nr:MAG: hypothetical protein AVDCRST_MAG30-2272 [uncultured Solirubrobacteraceae bacterium]
MPRFPPRALVGLAVVLLAGCGNERTPVPDVATPADPAGTRPIDLEDAGVFFTGPGNWDDGDARGALAGGVQSGRATVAVWRYPRTEPLPITRAQLTRVRDLLVERVRQRDPTFEPEASRVTRRAGEPAIELLGQQTIEGRRVKVRSAHVFAGGAEIVVDAYAPPADFDRLDPTVFLPALGSLRLRAPGTPR